MENSETFQHECHWGSLCLLVTDIVSILAKSVFPCDAIWSFLIVCESTDFCD